MILSVSRRTDIPAFFPGWFARRVREGFVYVQNPLNPRQIRRVDIDAENVAGIVFWSKNPQPLIAHLPAFEKYPFYIQYTLNAYAKDVEGKVPSLSRRIETFQNLAERLGPGRVLWRYDPILLSPRYCVSWHVDAFGRLAQALAGHTDTCTISFLDIYPKIARSLAALSARPPLPEEERSLAAQLSSIARVHGLRLFACAEKADLSAFSIAPARCVDPERIMALGGHAIDTKKDKNQRSLCGCAPSVDVGAYNTCSHACAYCYANHSPQSLCRRLSCYDESSPLLCSALFPEETAALPRA